MKIVVYCYFLKRTAAILLLGLFLFNSVGYRLWVNHVESSANDTLISEIDNNKYDESQLLLFKIPVSRLSYYNNSNQFERVNGQVEVRGIEYQFVKRRLYNDSLELYCIPNHTATMLRQVKNDFFKVMNDLQANESNKKTPSHPNIFKSFSTDDYTVNDALILTIHASQIIKSPANYAEALTSLYQFTAEHPPDFFA
ncbi:MAG: hypothetical protein JST75_18515 [Bacteroidetes bacterium]|nr:hypothetical protein [Bacteroidota bacterium]